MAKSTKIPSPEQAETPISSMIDIVFLLIIFFVVTASIDKDIEDERVSLADAPHGRPATKKDPRAVIINVRDDGTIKIGMNDNIKPEDVERILKNAIAKMPKNEAFNMPIVIRGDYNAQHYYIKQVMDAVKSTGLYKISFTGMQQQG